MMKNSGNPADPFKKALAEATRTMADDPEMTVTYSVDPAGMNKEGVRLPQVSRRMTRDEVLLALEAGHAGAFRGRGGMCSDSLIVWVVSGSSEVGNLLSTESSGASED